MLVCTRRNSFMTMTHRHDEFIRSMFVSLSLGLMMSRCVCVSVSVSFRWFAHFKPKHFAFYLSHFQHFRALHFIDTFFSLSLSLFVFPCACYFVYFFAKVLTPFLRSLITILQNCFSLSSQFYLLLCLALFLRCLADFFFLLYLFVCLFCTVCSILCLVVGCRFVCVSV